ncbi:hypothetical protein EDC04DRAFT_2616005 [Pisolithus marmoratus]|nr:hypothetical protein EDC04DRAFT_2616005 [Pisolithus marmoratus]
MHLQWFPRQAESFPLTPLNRNGDSSEENTLSLSSTVMPHTMNIDDLWSDIDAASPTVSKPSKPPIDAHAIIATMENPCSEAATNTAVAIRSIEPNLVDNPCPVPATNTAVVSSMGFNLGKHPAQVDTAWVDTSPPSDSTCEPFISSAEKEAQFATLTEKFEGTLHQVEASRSPIQMQKEAEVAALAQKFEDALRQVEVSKSQIQMEKETEIVALAQKFEGALHQVEEHVRELFSNIFSVTRDEDFLSHESPSHKVVMNFTKGNGPGPDPINLQWDFTSPKRSGPLSQGAMNTGKRRSNKSSTRIKVIWTKGRPKRLETGILETPAQVVARLMHTKMDDLKDTWKDTWRVADVELWQWLSDIIDHLGTDGMSSEDSEEEDMQTVFRVHDSKHKDWSISSPKGAKPVKHIRPSNPFPSARQPVCDLPATFYKPEWLEGNPTFKSDKVFQWSQFIVQGI